MAGPSAGVAAGTRRPAARHRHLAGRHPPVHQHRQRCALVGGIGVFFPGTTGYASAENSSLSADLQPRASRTCRWRPNTSPSLPRAAIPAANCPIGSIGGIPARPDFDLPFGRIDLAGITLDIYGPGGLQGPGNLVAYRSSTSGPGNPNSGATCR